MALPPVNDRLYRCTRAAITWPILRPYFRFRVFGAEHIPRLGAIIVCANHASYIDPVLLGAAATRSIRFMMLKSYYDKRFIRLLANEYGSFPVADEGVTPFTIRNCQEVLRRGEALGIFPEGGRTRSGDLMPGKPGALLLAMKAKAPIVPAAIKGAFESYPAERKWPRPGRITVRFGEPMTSHLAYDYPRDKAYLPGLTDDLMRRIRGLLDLGY